LEEIKMQKNVNPYRIYLKATREWVEVSEEYYRDHARYHDALRKRQQSHGQCVCPKNKFWLCDGDCFTCEFRRAGDVLSLDYTVENEEGDACSPLDNLADPVPSIEEIICDKAELDQLFARLNELMPEAVQIGKLRQDGLSDEAIAEIIGIKRTTFLSRLKKAKEQLATEFPDRF
jgi:DNA-directed RNA polymerase specialized sigma24 family protein